MDVPDGDNFVRFPKLLADNGFQNLTFVMRYDKVLQTSLLRNVSIVS